MKTGNYYIICLEEKSREGTLLFWKPEGKGYTSHVEDAGLFDKSYAKDINLKGRDIALTIQELTKLKAYSYTVMNADFFDLKNLKKSLEAKHG